MKQLRISKYNPLFRDEYGAYIRNEWTSYHDIGKLFDGRIFTKLEYEKVENSYIDAIEILAQKNRVTSMSISEFENYSVDTNDEFLQKFKEGQNLDLYNILILCRLILKEKLWCKFSCKDMYIHFGYDYYMYIGCNSIDDTIIKTITSLNLYMEEMESPYI